MRGPVQSLAVRERDFPLYCLGSLVLYYLYQLEWLLHIDLFKFMYGPVVHTILKKKKFEGESPLIRVAFAHRSVLCQNNVKEQ